MPTEDVKDVAGNVMKAFESFKETNDKRLAEIEKKGVADPVTLDKLAKIDVALNAGEELNQKLTLAAKQAEKMAEEQKALAEIVEKLEAKLGRPGAGSADEAKEKAAAYKAAFNSYLLSNAANGEAPSNDEFKLLNEYKVLQAGTDTLGGFYLAPSDMANEIIKNVVLQSPIRSIARVTAIGVKSLILPKRTGTFAATRVGELAARTETTGYTTGQVEIHCDEMYAEVRISQQMIEDSLFNIEAEMGLEFAEQFAVKEGTEFVSGTGVNGQAEGFLTNADILSARLRRGHDHRGRRRAGQRSDHAVLQQAQDRLRPQRDVDPQPRHARLGPQAEEHRQAVHLAARCCRRRAEHDPGLALCRVPGHAERGRRHVSDCRRRLQCGLPHRRPRAALGSP